jgi:uncharacterized OsmC-like protein
MNQTSKVLKNQKPLYKAYEKHPSLAQITDKATIIGKHFDNPFQTSVAINDELNVNFEVGVHRAVGGLHDAPNPGDMLCASLAACFESTLRMICNRVRVDLLETKVEVLAHVDVRGTLMIDPKVDVGFTSMEVNVQVKFNDSINQKQALQLLKSVERCCVIYQTLKQALSIIVNTQLL